MPNPNLIPTDDLDIVVYEGDDPLLALTLTDLQPDGTTIPFDLTNITALNFVVKNRESDILSAAVANYSLVSGVVIVAPSTGGKVTVQCLSSDATTTPGTKRFHLVGVRNSKRQTLMVGRFIVRDV